MTYTPHKPRPFVGIAAIGSNRVIGNRGRLPWHLPEDFKHFKNTTMGGVLVMGRISYEEIGRPLPGRDTVVLSRSGGNLPGVTVVSDIMSTPALFPGKTLFLAGGALVYKEFLHLCSELILTHVNLAPEGDAFFPDYSGLFDDGEEFFRSEAFTIRRHRRLP